VGKRKRGPLSTASSVQQNEINGNMGGVQGNFNKNNWGNKNNQVKNAPVSKYNNMGQRNSN